jgi:hypothetical protein
MLFEPARERAEQRDTVTLQGSNGFRAGVVGLGALGGLLARGMLWLATGGLGFPWSLLSRDHAWSTP